MNDFGEDFFIQPVAFNLPNCYHRRGAFAS